VAPVASAGPDQVVNEGDFVTLDASMSTDADNDPLTFLWSQTVGPNATLSDPAITMPTFTAPQVAADTMLTFAVAVDDGIFTNTDTVNVLVLDVSGSGGAGGTGAGGAGGTGAGGTGAGGTGTGGTGTGGTGGTGAGGTGTGGVGAMDASGTGAVNGSSSGGNNPDDDGGCGCEVAGESSAPKGSAFASLFLAAALLFRRRRSGSRS
jgi:MYXO-CTERM domain-containing protein